MIEKPAAARKRAKAGVSIYYKSPIGSLRITGSEKWVQAVEFCEHPGPDAVDAPECLQKTRRQLDEYFQGKRSKFELPLMMRGTAFQKRVWAALRRVPFGRTLSYGGIARAIGQPHAGRAVGGANHRNPVVIIVPCHRIIGHTGKLTGFGAGLWRKQWLLDHEKRARKP